VLWWAATGLAAIALPGLPRLSLAAALTAGCVVILPADVLLAARRRRGG
jgi:hypothetical protein